MTGQAVKRALVTGGMVIAMMALGASLLPRTSAAPAAERTFFVTVQEPRGGTTGLGAPAINPETLSKGYVYYPVGFDTSRPTRWEVASYVYAPASVAAFEGDRVTLKIFPVNGDKHDTTVMDPNGRPISFRAGVEGEGTPADAMAYDTARGRQTNISFRLARSGMYEVRCISHGPSMTLYVLSLPRR